MRHVRLICLAGLAIVFVSASAVAQDPDPDRGRDLAQRWCASCHVIGPTSNGGDAGPSFASVAARPGQTADEVRMWLADPHPPMPDFDLTAGQFDDLAAYIMTLRE